MITIGRLVYKASGIMSKKGIVKNSEKIGRKLADEIKTGEGKVKIDRIFELLERTIGKKKASNIIITDDFETFRDFARKNCKMSDDVIEDTFKHSLSLVMPPGKNGKTLLSLRTSNTTTTESLNITAHELEHVLYNNVSFSTKISRFIIKNMSDKKYESFLNSTTNIFNETMTDFQLELLKLCKIEKSASYGITEHKAGMEGLLKQTGCKNKEELHDKIRTIIRQDVLLPRCNIQNFSLLKVIRDGLQDEIRAYKVGGAVQRYVEPSETLTKSEMFARLCEEAANVLKAELKNQKKNIWRMILRKPPIDYHIPKPIEIERETSYVYPFINVKQSEQKIDTILENNSKSKDKFVGFS